MTSLVVGGVECILEEALVTFGHLEVPLRDIVLFGVANDPGELVVAFERRSEESGYRELRGAVRTRSTMTLALHGEHDLLIAWLRQRLPDRWRGYGPSVAHVVEGVPPEPPPEPLPPISWGRLVAAVVVGVVLAFVGLVVFFVLA